MVFTGPKRCLASPLAASGDMPRRIFSAVRCSRWKRWIRAAKIASIESRNPRWKDLAENWGKELLFKTHR
jgi:hypothetical protein